LNSGTDALSWFAHACVFTVVLYRQSMEFISKWIDCKKDRINQIRISPQIGISGKSLLSLIWVTHLQEELQVKKEMKMSLDNPSKSARLLMRSSVDESLRLQNEVFCNQLLRDIKSHPLFRNPAIDALKFGAFDKATLRDVHLDFRHGVVQIFTDAIVMAQFHTRQLEHRLGAKGKMASRFLLGLNLLDEFGFCPGYGEDNTERYRGNPLLSHPLLFDAMLEEFNVDDLVRDYFLKSEAAKELRSSIEVAFGDLWSLLVLLVAGEEVVLVYTPAMRRAARMVGVNVEHGYYMAHGSSEDSEVAAFDDDHQRDALEILICTIEPHQYAKVRAVAMDYCTLWDCFWREQMRRLEYSPFSRQAS